MKKFDGILLCTDLDGTLLRHDKTVSRENMEAIEYFKSEGGLFTFITGRMPVYSRDIYERLRPNAPIGCINGGGIYDYETAQYLWVRTLPREALALIPYIMEHCPEVGVQISTLDKVYFCKENPTMRRFRALTGLPNLTARYDEIDETIAKALIGAEEEASILRVKALLDAHPLASTVSFIRSAHDLYEILPRDISKGEVLMRMAELLGLDPARTVAVGDYDNDVSLLRAAGIGYAVENAVPAAKAAADRITVSNEDHAIARIIADLDAE